MSNDNYYAISCGSKGKLFTLRHHYFDSKWGYQDKFVKTLGSDLEASKQKAIDYLPSNADIRVVVSSVEAITRRSDVNWFEEPVDFGKYVGQSAKWIAQEDYRYFLWVVANGAKKWQKVFGELLELPEYAVLKEKLEATYPDNVKKKFASEYPDVVAFLESESFQVGTFFHSLYVSYIQGSNIKQRAIEIVRGEITKREANIKSEHVGSVGERNQMKLKIESIRKYETRGYTYSNSIILNYAHSMKDEQGNVVVYLGTSKLGVVGDVLTLKGTIKKHDVYKGVNQTVIARPNVISFYNENEEVA